MGFFKKVFGESGVLARLAGSNQRGSHQLVCQQLAARHQQGHYITTVAAQANNRHPHLAQFQQQTSISQPIQQQKTFLYDSTNITSSKRSRKRQARKQQEVACLSSLEAEMLASLSQMPALKFHPVHGPNAQLSDNMMSARRTQSFCEAIVFSDRLIMPNERIYIRVLDIAKGWNGTIRFGFTACDPDKFRYEPIPKHACPDMTQAGHTWAHALADKLVKRDTIIHFSYSPSGFIQYGINNQECGVFVAKVKTSEPLWFVIDIYGLTTAIELIDPRLAQSSNDENVLFAGQQHVRRSSSLALPAGTVPLAQQQSRHERRAAKLAASSYYQQHQQKILQAARSASRTLTSSQSMAYLQRQQQRANFLDHHTNTYGNHRVPVERLIAQSANEELPNLSNIMLPLSRQNIYTSLPVTQAANQQQHDQQHYYQLQSTSSLYGNTQLSSTSTLSSAASTDRLFDSSGGRLDSSSSAQLHRSINVLAGDEEAVTRCLTMNQSDSSQNIVNTSSSTGNLHHNTANTSATTTIDTSITSPITQRRPASSQRAPVAATRRTQRATNNSEQTSSSNSRHQNTTSKSNSNTANNQQITPVLTNRNCTSQQTVSGSNSRARQTNARSSSKQTNAIINNNNVSQKDTNNNNSIARDKNNNSPITKDCPICFERPINCVLYQCGHMCTCYECGVKQWRTQSRTCPICRTVIKDVIKTYLS